MNKVFAHRLLEWYERNGRNLPWRNTHVAYEIWLSEIILQQTRVAQGYDYYVRFLKRFPSVESLASASQDEVLKYWQGLGYYSRARNLHAAAKDIVAQGKFPDTYDEIIKLKGVGEYTAAAIASFAFDEQRAVVDGNVYRVLARVFAIDTPIDSTLGKKTFQALAQELMPNSNSARYNQSIMDFGALQCTPRTPSCVDCPLLDVCEAFAQKEVECFPVKEHTIKVTERYFTYFVISKGEEILLRQRNGEDIWKGLYELPMVESDHKLTLQEVENLSWIKGSLELLREKATQRLSHQLLHADLYRLQDNMDLALNGIWVKRQQVSEYALPKLVLQLLRHCDIQV